VNYPLNSKHIWLYCANQKLFWRTLEPKQNWTPWTKNTDMFQHIFFCVPPKKEIQKCLERVSKWFLCELPLLVFNFLSILSMASRDRKHIADSLLTMQHGRFISWICALCGPAHFLLGCKNSTSTMMVHNTKYTRRGKD